MCTRDRQEFLDPLVHDFVLVFQDKDGSCSVCVWLTVRLLTVQYAIYFPQLPHCTNPSQQLPLHPFNGLFSRTAWVSRYQKGKTVWMDLNEARYDGVWGWQWYQLDHMQTICISLQADNRTNTSPNQGTEGININPQIGLLSQYTNDGKFE